MKKSKLHKILSFSIACAFLFNSLCSGLDLSYNRPDNNTTLAPPSIFQKSSLSEGSKEFKKSIISDINLLTVCLPIAQYLLVDERDKAHLAKHLRDRFRNDPKNVKLATELVKNADFGKNKKGERIVALIPYRRKNEEYIIKIYDKDKLRYVKKKDTNWGIFNEYGRFKDFGGFGIQVVPASKKKTRIKALVSNSLIEKLHSNGDINYWDAQIRNGALNDSQKVTIKVLLHRGVHDMKVLRFDIPRILLLKKHRRLLIKYITASIYNVVIHKSAEDIIIIVNDKKLEKEIYNDIKKTISNEYQKINVYGNFGHKVHIMNSDNFKFEIKKALKPDDRIPEPIGVVVGVDVGGTNIKTIVMNGAKVIYSKSVSTNKKGGGKALKALIINVLREALQSEKVKDEKVEAIGIAFPAPVKEEADGTSTVLRLTNYERYWSNSRKGNTDFTEDYTAINSIGEDIKSMFNIKNISIIRDAKAFGFWELIDDEWNNDGKGEIAENIVVINPIGTGAGYIEINKGMIEAISHQGGHMVIDLSDNAEIDPGCGVKGCYGAYVSGKSEFIKKQLGETTTKEISNVLNLLPKLGELIAREMAKTYDITGAKKFIITGGVTQDLTGPQLVKHTTGAFMRNYPALANKIEIVLDESETKWSGAKGVAQYANMIAQEAKRNRAYRKWDMTFNLPKTIVGSDIVETTIKELKTNKNKKYCIVLADDVYEYLKKKHEWINKFNILKIDDFKNVHMLKDEIVSNGYTGIIVIGAGTVTDWAKFIGDEESIEVISIPSTLSTNTMFAYKAIIYSGEGVNRRRISRISGVPDKTIIDIAFLREFLDFMPPSKISGVRANRAGVADVICGFVALLDWKLADSKNIEKIDRAIYAAVEKLLHTVKDNVEDIRNNTDIGMILMSEILAQASLIMMRYKTSRPLDGSEHLLVDEIDRRIDPSISRIHGELVAISIIIMMYLFSDKYNPEEFNEVRKLIEDLGLPIDADKLGATKDIIVEALTRKPTRTDKYTYFDGSRLTKEDAKLIYDRLFGEKKEEIEGFSVKALQEVMNSSTAMFDHLEKNVYPFLDKKKTDNLIDTIIETKKRNGRILLNASGRIGEVGVFFLQKLNALGYNVNDLKEITPEFLVLKDDFVLTLSETGATFSVVDNIEHIISMHDQNKLDRKIYSITATPSAPIWSKGKKYHEIIEVKGKVKQIEWLPFSSIFEYSVALYLEGIIEALSRSQGSSKISDSFEVVKDTMDRTIKDVRNKLYKQLNNIELKTLELLQKFEMIKKRHVFETSDIKKEPSIYFFGLGQNNYITRLFARRMRNIGFNAYVPGPRDIVPRPQPNDIAIFISNSGKRPQIINKINIAKEKKNYVILLTANENSTSAKLADLVIPICRETTSSHTVDVMGKDEYSIQERHIKRLFEITSMLYFEGLSSALMKILKVKEKNLQHVPKQWELKGPKAPKSNPIIECLISEGKMVEVALEGDSLIAYKIDYIDGYKPGIIDSNKYRGSPLDISGILNKKQTANLIKWISSHRINGKPVKFRVALGKAMLGWQSDIDHSNVAHAGKRDNAIYIGELLLKHILKTENESLKTEILDRDEFRHLQGLEHGTPDEYRKRLQLIKSPDIFVGILKAKFGNKFSIGYDYMPLFLERLPYAANGDEAKLYKFADVIIDLIERTDGKVINMNHLTNNMQFILGLNPDKVSLETKMRFFREMGRFIAYLENELPKGFKFYIDKLRDLHIFGHILYLNRAKLKEFDEKKTKALIAEYRKLVDSLLAQKLDLSYKTPQVPEKFVLSRGIKSVKSHKDVDRLNTLPKKSVKRILQFLSPNSYEENRIPRYDLSDPFIDEKTTRVILPRELYGGAYIDYARLLFYNSKETSIGIAYQDAIWLKRKKWDNEQADDHSFRLYMIFERHLREILEKGIRQHKITKVDRDRVLNDLGLGVIVHRYESDFPPGKFKKVFYEPFINEGEILTEGGKWIFEELQQVLLKKYGISVHDFHDAVLDRPKNTTYSGYFFDADVVNSKIFKDKYFVHHGYLDEEEFGRLWNETTKNPRDEEGTFAHLDKRTDFKIVNSGLTKEKFNVVKQHINEELQGDIYICFNILSSDEKSDINKLGTPAGDKFYHNGKILDFCSKHNIQLFFNYEEPRAPGHKYKIAKKYIAVRVGEKLTHPEEIMNLIHKINMNLLPPVQNGKILWHVIPTEIIPRSIRSEFVNMVSNVNRNYPDLREKIKVVTDRQDLNEVIGELLSDSNNIVDAAVADRKDLEKLPEGVKALVFEGRLGEFRQLEGVFAALRALQQSNTHALLELYEILTGERFNGNEEEILKYIENPKKLINIIIFNLKPIEIHNHKELKELNKALLELIQAA